MIRVEQLSRYYGQFAALDGIDLDIDGRDVVGFLGLNGAGKSTLMAILAGLLQPTSGRVHIDGHDLSVCAQAVRGQIGFCPDSPPLYLEMRVRAFLRHCAQLYRVRRSTIERQIDHALETCALTTVADRVIGTLSYGYRKRVGLARGIVHQPRLVLLDEPISGLDPLQIVEMRRVMARLAESATVITSSHILSEVAQTCARVIVLHEGRLVGDVRADQLAGEGAGLSSAISLTLRAPIDALEAQLEASAYVRAIRSRRCVEGDVYELGLELDGDTREALVRELAAAGVGIRRIDDARSEIESLFVRLTAEAVAPPGGGGQ